MAADAPGLLVSLELACGAHGSIGKGFLHYSSPLVFLWAFVIHLDS